MAVLVSQIDVNHRAAIVLQRDVRLVVRRILFGRVNGQFNQMAAVVVNQERIVTGNAFVYIPQRHIGRCCALEPQRVAGQRHLGNGVIELVGRELGDEVAMPVVDDHIVGRQTRLAQHGAHVIGQTLAVAKTGAAHLGGGKRLPAADAQLDAHIACGLGQVTVDDIHLAAVAGASVGHGMQLRLEFGRQLLQSRAQRLVPCSKSLPRRHVTSDAVKLKFARSPQDVGHGIASGG